MPWPSRLTSTTAWTRTRPIATFDRGPDFVSNQGFSCALEEVVSESCLWHFESAGRYVVTAGLPRGSDPEAALVALQSWATRRGARPLLFGVEPSDLRWLILWKVREIGRQPLFLAGQNYLPELSGPQQPERSREIRRQARRALSKGVAVKEISAATLWHLSDSGQLDELLETRWRKQPLAELSFLVALRLPPGQSARRYFLLESPVAEAAPVGLAILVSCHRGWLLEHQILSGEAPNGTGELIICSLLSSALNPGEILSLGITPLYRALEPGTPANGFPSILGFLPQAASTALLAAFEPFYGFRSLYAYRAKLEPDSWEPVYWAHTLGGPLGALLAVLRVFAGGSLWSFALASIWKFLEKVSSAAPVGFFQRANAAFGVSLCAWIPILWNLNGELVFGNRYAPQIWAFYDLILLGGFWLHQKEISTKRGSGFVAAGLLGLVVADALLSFITTLAVHGWAPVWSALGLFLLLLNLGPLAATLFLTACLARARRRFLP